MPMELWFITVTAATIAFIHTVLGPDHYIPFIVMSRAGKWTITKTLIVASLCGLGHILSSVLLGMGGMALGLGVSRIQASESIRGSLATWALISFGLVYFVWGIRNAYKKKTHSHHHLPGISSSHLGQHQAGFFHPQEKVEAQGELAGNITPWVLFTIFVLGPCEPLIPIIMYPGLKSNFWELFYVVLVFGSVTIATMITLVMVSYFGISYLPLHRLERYMHALAGVTILSCGLAIQFLRL